jgi:hypothetical protein
MLKTIWHELCKLKSRDLQVSKNIGFWNLCSSVAMCACDKSLRMAKTAPYELCKLKGTDIYK